MAGIPDKVLIDRGCFGGSVAAPPSKSVMQRVLALLLLRNASLEIRNYGRSEDDATLISILEQAGYAIELQSGYLRLRAPHTQSLDAVHFRDSGLAARMLLPILATRPSTVRLDASPQLRSRGFGTLIDVLRNAGAAIETDPDGWPVTVRGPLVSGDIFTDGSFSSQPVTGLLYALSSGSGPATLRVGQALSAPYIDLSLEVMADLGFPLPQRDGYDRFTFEPGRQLRPAPAHYTVPGDWSAAAFWLVAGAIAGPVQVTGLDAFSAQGDKQVLQPLMDAGARLSIEAEQITARPAPLQAFHYNATHTPDLFPPLAVLASFAQGQSVIEGVGRLASKESDRAATIISELGKLGADIRLQDDLMIVTGTALHGGTVQSHGDHRIAMMGAIAALGASDAVCIEGAAAVGKSYPDFFDHLQALGGGVTANTA